MPLPLVPVAVAGAAAWLAFEPGQAPAAGAAPAPEEQKPFVDPRPPRPDPYSPASPPNPTPRAGGDPPIADPAMSVVEGGLGTAENYAKAAVVGAASVGVHTVLGGGTLAEGFTAAGESIGSSATSAAEGAAGVVGPAVVVGADVLMVAGAIYSMFGGDIGSLLGMQGGPLSPEFDISTPAGQFHAREEAKVIAQSLAEEPGMKFSLKQSQPNIGLDVVPGAMADPDTPPMTAQQARTLGIGSTLLNARNRAIDLAA